MKSLQKLSQYCDRFRDRFGSSGIPLSRKTKIVTDLLHQLHSQVHARKAKNTDILTLSQEVSCAVKQSQTDEVILCIYSSVV